MNNPTYSEYDNYDYRTSDELSLSEQIAFVKQALKSVKRISKTNKNDYWIKKMAEIQLKLQQLESETPSKTK